MDLVMLDSGPLNRLTFPSKGATPDEAALYERLAQTVPVFVPEVIRYESRRKFLHLRLKSVAAADVALGFLDALCDANIVDPTNTAVFERGADLWAAARVGGYMSADETSLDIDVLLAAHALLAERDDIHVVLWTTNKRHLSAYGADVATTADLNARMTAAGR